MSKKRDWVKIIAIGLAILFFIFWIYAGYSFSNEEELRFNYENDLILCKAELENQKQICINAIGDSGDLCEKTLLEYQSKYDCWERGTVECYKNGDVICYEK